MVSLISSAIDCNPITLAEKVISIEDSRGVNQGIYKVKLSSLCDFEDDFDIDGCDMIYLLTTQGGRFEIKTMKSFCVEHDCIKFELVGDFHAAGFEVWTQTHGGDIFSFLHCIQHEEIE